MGYLLDCRLLLQSACRVESARVQLRCLREAAMPAARLRLHLACRSHIARCALHSFRTRPAAVRVQTCWRRHWARRLCGALREEQSWPLRLWFEVGFKGDVEARLLPNPSYKTQPSRVALDNVVDGMEAEVDRIARRLRPAWTDEEDSDVDEAAEQEKL